ncbi:hypothetical protein [Leifsonia sp. TF02-11]|uniref:hypothetical protein n=1 Tax=Leifsonia sp. TF02-11 TaxID=2815212 RepID=UPI001AA0B782|nr:hypothetical protein [Leifsonia sp. TF02-11]MBO1739757.1 hypothetical protein [Leifsonia sp. TF02-11]
MSEFMRKIRVRPVLSSALIAAVIGLPLITFSSLVAFDPPFAAELPTDLGSADFSLSPAMISMLRVIIWFGVRVLFLLLFAVAVYYVRRFFAKVHTGDPVYLRWLFVGLALTAVNIVVLLLIWPGLWIYDEYYVLTDVQQNWLGTWQHVFTSLYFGVAMTLIPTPAGILIIQSVFGSFVAGYIVARSWSILKRPQLAYLLIVPFLFFPVLLYVQNPLRVTMMSFIELAVLFRVVAIHLRRELVTDRYREFFFLSTAAALAAFWRSEATLLLVLIPVLAISLRVFQPRKAGVRVRTAIAALVATGLAFTGIAGTSVATASPRYAITAVINPLSAMLQGGELGGANLERNLKAIDRVVDVKKVKQQPKNIYNIPAFFTAGIVRDGYRSHLTEFELAYASLVAENPGAFLDARMQTFLATNAMGPIPVNKTQGWDFLISDVAQHYKDDFEQRNPLAVPISPEVRHAAAAALLTVSHDAEFTALTPVVWNVTPVLLLVALAFVAALVLRRWMFALVFGLLAAQAGITFLTAPANHFMYYFAVYLVGWVMLVLFTLSADTRGRRSSPGRP